MSLISTYLHFLFNIHSFILNRLENRMGPGCQFLAIVGAGGTWTCSCDSQYLYVCFRFLGGLEQFQQKYDNLCVQCAKPKSPPLYSPTSATVQEPASIDNATASQILNFLYLGEYLKGKEEHRLKFQ